MFNVSLTKEDILSCVDEYDLWRFYSPFEKLGKNFSSEFRVDKTPSCSIFLNKDNRFIYKDFGNGDTFDIFSYIQFKFKCNISESINIIANDFNLLKNNQIEKTIIYSSPIDYTKKMKENKIIKVKTREWSLKDKIYWSEYFVTPRILQKYMVFPIETYIVIKDNDRMDFKCKTLTYGYWFGGDEWKIYSPYEKKERKHITNTNKFFGFAQLPNTSKDLIITSSPKDVLVWKSLKKYSISPTSESVNLQKNFIEDLQKRFKNIYINFDNDDAGIQYTKKCIDSYPFLKPIFTKDAKDISDCIKLYASKERMQSEISQFFI